MMTRQRAAHSTSGKERGVLMKRTTYHSPPRDWHVTSEKQSKRSVLEFSLISSARNEHDAKQDFRLDTFSVEVFLQPFGSFQYRRGAEGAMFFVTLLQFRPPFLQELLLIGRRRFASARSVVLLLALAEVVHDFTSQQVVVVVEDDEAEMERQRERERERERERSSRRRRHHGAEKWYAHKRTIACATLDIGILRVAV